MRPTNSDAVYSISQLNYAVKCQLEADFSNLWLTGEISNFSQPASGHWYFSLKDNHAQARSVMFRGQNYRTSFLPQNGMQVLVQAKVSLYEARGDYQLIVETMHNVGDGILQQQFEQLKKNLSARGWFAPHLKKSLPSYCNRVGIITSPTGAALHDILQVIQRRDPQLNIVIYPTLVQGKEASKQIAEMINLANQRQEVDVLIVGRGGGSLEDLWNFNEEIVAEAIFHSQLPIISAVGHEVDVTIADFVADIRAATPSVAGELVSGHRQVLRQQLQDLQQYLEMAMDRHLRLKQIQLQQNKNRLLPLHPQHQLYEQQNQYQQYHHRLHLAIQGYMENQRQCQQRLYQQLCHSPLPLHLQKQQQHITHLTQCLKGELQQHLQQRQYQLAQLCESLNQLSPLAVLARGYSMTENAKGQHIQYTTQVKKGDLIKTRLEQGVIYSRVERVE